ncbi:MAG TPA: long-chain fatty acid--CoA ligase [Aliidongia sp.]|uniref:AMP-dependent synthetase/ligase n=1 Tax=Aliidongia sp. TaxID=1914230 RepID=UPI002DDD0463|nr:long-chain fatty acid--CoA ligase [Aliidongia sp.]HEV2677745.1 long-chain fatty acid--CoA ligase [Aliidongia sp.]
MIESDWPNLPAMFLHWAARKGDRPFLWVRKDKDWVALSWAEVERRVRRLASGLTALGIRAGDRVALVAENRPEWAIADLAIMAAGAVTVPAYTTFTTEDYRHVFANSGAKALILSSNALAQRVLPAADQLSYLKTIISLEPLKGQANADVYLWDDVMAMGTNAPDRVDEVAGVLGPDDTACLIYTSGTGGVPKAVMQTHRNVMHNGKGARKLLDDDFGLGDEVFLSFLPLTHAYEHSAGLWFPIMIGAEIYYAGGPETLATEMPEVRPTIMTAVPRLFEMLHKRIAQAAERSGGMKTKLFRLACDLGIKRYKNPSSLTLKDRALDLVVDRLVRRKVRQRFGGRLKAFVSGGAPLNQEVGLFFLALGINLMQGYGQTEAGPVISANPPRRIKVDSVGPPLLGVEVKIAEDGEILVKGANVMKGYWQDPEATDRALKDGWLHTGDVGEFDADGYLKITDRKRDFIKNSGGEMISPQRIEGYLSLEEGVGQVMVYGDKRPYLVALIVPDDALLRDTRSETDPAARQARLQQEIQVRVAKVNKMLNAPERIRRFAVVEEAFSVANGQMTPTLKIKRHAIRSIHGALLESLYDKAS